MCIATVDIEVVQEIYFFFVFFQIQVMILKRLLIFLCFILLENDMTLLWSMWQKAAVCESYMNSNFCTSIPVSWHFIVNLKEQVYPLESTTSFLFGYWYLTSSGSADFSFVQVQCHCPNDTCNSYYYTIKVVPSLPCHCRNDTCLWKIEKQSNLSLQIRYTRGLLRLPEFCFEIRQRQQKWTTLA
jgi:hypothetical protein